MAYGHSPFEVEGSSVVLAVQNGQYRFPQNDKVYSQGLRDLIAHMLVVDKNKRPNIHQVSGSAYSVPRDCSFACKCIV